MDSSSFIMLLRTVGSLGLVLVLIYLLSWVAKKYFRMDQWASPREESGLKLGKKIAIDPKHSLMVVEWNQKRLLIGLTESQISVLSGEAAAIATSKESSV